MAGEIKELIQSNPSFKKIVKKVLENPYIEKHKLMESLDVPDEDAEDLLSTLEEKQVILELASQANSNVESRVPKTIYLINPEVEEDIKGILQG